MSKTKTVWALSIENEITDVSLHKPWPVSGKHNCAIQTETIFWCFATHCGVYLLNTKLKQLLLLVQSGNQQESL